MAEEQEMTVTQEMPCQDGKKATILYSSQMKNQQCQLETLGIVAFMRETFDIPAPVWNQNVVINIIIVFPYTS